MRNTKGITLIALVITIIVLLILAGVAIATFSGENGILTQAERAAKVTRGAELDEIVNLAISEATLEDGDVTIKDIGDILQDDGILEDGKLEWVDGGNTGYLKDVVNDIVVEVTVDPRPNTNIFYPNDVDDFETVGIEVSKTLSGNNVTITLDITSNKTDSNITVTGSGVNKEITGSGTVTTTVTENGTYIFTVTDGSGNSREVTVVVNEFLEISDLNSIQISKSPSDVTKDNVVVTISYDSRAESAIEYRVGTSGNWNSATNPQTVTVTTNNTTVYARYNNGTETAKETSTTVSNIDKEAPNSFNVTTTNITTSSITVSGSTTDSGSGIAGYEFGIAKQGESIVWTSRSTSTTHTFNNLEQNTEYTVVAKAIDKVGLERQTANLNVTTREVTGAVGNVTMTPSTGAATNQNVQVTMSTTTGLNVQYQIDSTSGLWVNYTSPVLITENGVIYVRLVDNAGQTNNTTAALNILNIDKVAPNSFSLTTSNIETESFTVNGSTTDTGSTGTALEHIGIDRYEVKLLSSTNDIITDWTTIGTATTYNFTNLENDIEGAIASVPTPTMGTGMTKVAWDSSNNEFTPTTDDDWYAYIDTSTGGTDYKVSIRAIDKAGNITEVTNASYDVSLLGFADTSKWANAKTSDGSYWVWIPRYEYKLNESAQTIDINFIPVSQTTPTSGYKIHPAFENGSSTKYTNGEWDKELAGIWVMKYEASNESNKPKSVPGVISWRSIDIGDMYSYSLSFDSTKGSHLMKNSEWGAVAYLAHSEYGRNGVEVTINTSSSYYTGGGTETAYKTNVNQSTTGNVTGIYDLSGNAYERVAGYIPNGTSQLLSYGSPMITSTTDGANTNGYLSYSTKYVTAYPYSSSDSYESNYNQYAAVDSSTYGYGDAVLETSTTGEGSTSWHGDYSYFPHSTFPFFIRGGYYGYGSNAGLFSFSDTVGYGSSNGSFRAVLAF